MDMESGTAAVTGISKTKLVYKTADVAVHNVLFGFVFADGELRSKELLNRVSSLHQYHFSLI